MSEISSIEEFVFTDCTDLKVAKIDGENYILRGRSFPNTMDKIVITRLKNIEHTFLDTLMEGTGIVSCDSCYRYFRKKAVKLYLPTEYVDKLAESYNNGHKETCWFYSSFVRDVSDYKE